MTRVVFLLTDGVHLLDVAGPAQAFAGAAEASGEPWDLRYVGETSVVMSHQGLPLYAELGWPDLDSGDYVLVPGWKIGAPIRERKFADATLARLRECAAHGVGIVSVCAGAVALAQAGLLDGRRATTHHALQEQLAQAYPAVRVVRDVLYARDGNVLTSAGIASGIDLALRIVQEHHGPRTAAKVARDMVIYLRRNGHEPQDSAMLRYRDHLEETVHRAQDIIDEHFAEPIPLAALARRVGNSERTLTRAFTRAVGMTPLRYQQALRVERAEQLIAAGSTVEAAAHEVGFDDARMLRTLRSRR